MKSNSASFFGTPGMPHETWKRARSITSSLYVGKLLSITNFTTATRNIKCKSNKLAPVAKLSMVC